MPLRAYSFAALVILATIACAPAEPQTTDVTNTGTTDAIGPDSTTDLTDAPTDSTTAEPTTAPDSSTGLLTDTTTLDPTAGGPATCAELCQRIVDCDVPLALDACIDECEATEPTPQTCLLACDQPVCADLLHCTTVCNHPGDPNASPYAPCGEDASKCQPGVYICQAAKHGDEQFSVCAPFCDEDQPCPVPTTGNAPTQCDLSSRPSTCSLDCSDGQQCPDDMVCDIKGGICSHPLP